MCRSSRQEVFCKKGALRNFAKFTGKHLCQSLFFNKVAGLSSANTGLVSSRVSLTSWGEGASLALVGHPSSDGVTIKMPYGVDVLQRPASHPIFSYSVG